MTRERRKYYYYIIRTHLIYETQKYLQYVPKVTHMENKIFIGYTLKNCSNMSNLFFAAEYLLQFIFFYLLTISNDAIIL